MPIHLFMFILVQSCNACNEVYHKCNVMYHKCNVMCRKYKCPCKCLHKFISNSFRSQFPHLHDIDLVGAMLGGKKLAKVCGRIKTYKRLQRPSARISTTPTSSPIFSLASSPILSPTMNCTSPSYLPTSAPPSVIVIPDTPLHASPSSTISAFPTSIPAMPTSSTPSFPTLVHSPTATPLMSTSSQTAVQPIYHPNDSDIDFNTVNSPPSTNTYNDSILSEEVSTPSSPFSPSSTAYTPVNPINTPEDLSFLDQNFNHTFSSFLVNSGFQEPWLTSPSPPIYMPSDDDEQMSIFNAFY